MGKLSRREFMGTAAMAGAALSGMGNSLAGAQALKSAADWDEKNGPAPAAPDAPQARPVVAGAIPIIDAHIHLFDQTRPVFSGYTGGLFYRQVNKPSTPAAYAALARPTGIVGAIVVESAAQYIDDNLYYLETSHDNPIMVGVSGNIDPGSAEFGKYLNHFHRDPLFRAIRSSRFYSRDASGKVALNPTQVANLKLLAQADLALDTANPSMDLMNANVLLADAVPDLRIIMDHLPSFDPTPDGQAAYEEVIKEMAARPNISVKLTEVYHPKPGDGGVIVKNYEVLRARLEYLFDAFGEDRVMFGTDYPNSYGVATISEEVGLMQQFFATKPRAQQEKYFWQNSSKIYKWVKRADDQPTPLAQGKPAPPAPARMGPGGPRGPEGARPQG
ncbi:MAG: amidohydrolase family protein [Acidobacteriaceae bacterium]|jgi:predicted TIM-barrel fold metal-dependent hydrolase